MRHAAIIYNPASGAYRKRNRMAEMRDFAARLREGNIESELHPTRGPADATTLAREAIAAGCDGIIASGGDGTLNEVLQALHGHDVPLAILPAGTANVLALDLGLPSDPEQLARMIFNGVTQSIAIGRAGERYFFLMAGIGLDAAIIRDVSCVSKKRFGKLAYALSTGKVLLGGASPPFQLEIEGQTFTCGFAVLGNTPSYGGGLRFTPRARPDETMLDACLYPPRRWPGAYVQDLGMAWSGNPQCARGVIYRKTRKVIAHPLQNDEAWVQVDGDIIGKLPMEFEIATETIDVIVP